MYDLYFCCCSGFNEEIQMENMVLHNAEINL